MFPTDSPRPRRAPDKTATRCQSHCIRSRMSRSKIKKKKKKEKRNRGGNSERFLREHRIYDEHTFRDRFRHEDKQRAALGPGFSLFQSLLHVGRVTHVFSRSHVHTHASHTHAHAHAHRTACTCVVRTRKSAISRSGSRENRLRRSRFFSQAQSSEPNGRVHARPRHLLRQVF